MNERSSPTTLYRLFDDEGDLLYVGIAGNPGRRFEQHRSDKPWWGEVSGLTLEHHPDRAAALAAELKAIRSENPRHNIAGRNGNGPPLQTVTAGGRGWTFESVRSGYQRTGCELTLGWEANGSSYSYDAGIEDPVEAVEEWIAHMRRADDRGTSHYISPKGWVDIAWYVIGDGGVFEAAPFQVWRPPLGDFLTYFTWPTGPDGYDLNWYRLPIRGVKSQFITDATGFVPGPLQPALHLPTLEQMAWREHG